jgi:hypothetical protein
VGDARVSVLFHAVEVGVAVAFDHAWIGALASFGQQVARVGDLGDDLAFGC